MIVEQQPTLNLDEELQAQAKREEERQRFLAHGNDWEFGGCCCCCWGGWDHD